MALLENFSDSQIRAKLAEFGHPVGPITETTRKILLKKLTVLMKEKKDVRPAKSNIYKYSSAEESGSENEQYGGVGPNKRLSMPPPANFRSRRKVNTKNSPLNSTISDFRANSPPDLFSSPRLSLGRSTYRQDSLRGGPRLSNYDFESGSDSDVRDVGNNSRTWSSREMQKDSRPLLSTLTKRLTRFGNDVNYIKETDVDEGPSYLTRSHTYNSFRGLPAPVKSTYETPRTESNGLSAQLQQWGPVLLLSLFLVFFLWLGATYCLRVYFSAPRIASKQNVYPICTNDLIGTVECIPSEDLAFAVALYRSVHQELLSRAVRSVCGPTEPDGSYISPYMTEKELVLFLLKSRPEDILRLEKGVRHLGLLLVSNPHWGVSVLKKNDEQTPTVHYNAVESLKALPSDLAQAVPLLFITPWPELSFTCRAKLFSRTFLYYASASLVVGGIIYVLFMSVRHYLRVAKEEEQQVMNLVERIIKEVTTSCNQGNEFIPVRHVRDIIIPLKDRTRMRPLWERAVQSLEENESRVRKEVQIAHGEETEVYRLLTPATPSTPSSPSSPPSPINPPTPDPADNHLYPDLSVEMQREGQRVWQGEAFETSEGSMNSLPVSPTQCLKIRHMFQQNKNYGVGWEVAVQDAIIEKCEGVRIVHVAVDSHSKEGCVYLKCSSSHEAGEAFRRLHGSWFDGALVTVKYLRLERYHERFPDSVNCRSALRPSNNLRLSLGGRSST